MQGLLKFLSLVFLFSILSSNCLAAAETYQLDPAHTYVNWRVSHFGFSEPSGKWMATGTLILDEAKPENSKVSVSIPVTDVVTGIPKFDKHLRTSDFFDVSKFPTATFVSNKVTVTGKDTANVQGVLTLHGVSKPITLEVKLNKLGVSPVSNKKTVGFSAKTQIKRSDFGITKFLPGVGDEVNIAIEAEANVA